MPWNELDSKVATSPLIRAARTQTSPYSLVYYYDTNRVVLAANPEYRKGPYEAVDACVKMLNLYAFASVHANYRPLKEVLPKPGFYEHEARQDGTRQFNLTLEGVAENLTTHMGVNQGTAWCRTLLGLQKYVRTCE